METAGKSRALAENSCEHKGEAFQLDKHKFLRVPKGTMKTCLPFRLPLRVAGLKASSCIRTHQASGARKGRWRDLFTTLFISTLTQSEFYSLKTRMSR